MTDQCHHNPEPKFVQGRESPIKATKITPQRDISKLCQGPIRQLRKVGDICDRVFCCSVQLRNHEHL